jgi:hypothetical protein
MADRINPNRKNRLSPKEIAKRSAALTLLLSTIACSSDGFKDLLPAAGIVLIYVLWNSIGWFFFGGREEYKEIKKRREEEEARGPWEPPGGWENYGKH